MKQNRLQVFSIFLPSHKQFLSFDINFLDRNFQLFPLLFVNNLKLKKFKGERKKNLYIKVLTILDFSTRDFFNENNNKASEFIFMVMKY